MSVLTFGHIYSESFLVQWQHLNILHDVLEVIVLWQISIKLPRDDIHVLPF